MAGHLTFGEFLVASLAVLTFPLGVVALLVAGPVTAAAVFGVGWLVALPLTVLVTYSMGLLGDDRALPWTGETDDAAPSDPLETLKDRYARGELEDEGFERQVDRLVELDGVEVPDDVSVPEGVDAGESDPDERGREESERERDREATFER